MEPVKEVPVTFTRKYTLVEHTCPYCGMVFQGPRLRRYCSDKCQQNAHWHRNAERYNAARNDKRNKGGKSQ